ncbi:MAG TPA: hypothetical protein VNC50_17145, partial [Planctomycetia bacterium]|nr:hypothetical protein [Planctomycetia bacterium]
YGKSIDVYSAAVIAFEMLAGDVPFDGESAGEILMKHLTAAPALEKLDVKWRGVFAKALAKDPADRFATAGELLEALRAINRGEQPDFAPPRAPGAMGPPPMPRAGYAGADENYQRYVQAIDRLHQHPPTTTDLETSLPPMPGTLKSKRRGVADTLWAMFMTAIMAAALPAFAYAIETAFHGDLIADPQAYVWIGALTTFLSWSVILFTKSWKYLNVDGATRRVTLGLWGLASGAASLILASYVAGPLPRSMEDVVQIGGSDGRLSRPTYVLEYIWSHHRPELFQVALLFAALMVVPNWDKIGGASRTKKFSLWQAIWVTSLAGIGAGIFSESTGTLWTSFSVPLAASFSLTALVVQWATPFAPPLPAPRVANKLRRLRRSARPNYV